MVFSQHPENAYCRIAEGTLLARAGMHISKKKRIGAMRWRALRLQIRYSPESIQGAVV